MKILIIEDEHALVESMTDYLAHEGYHCEAAFNLPEAEEKVALYSYDLILLDLTLPGGSGLELLEKIQSVTQVPGVIILTARNSLDDKITGLDLGADDYLTKPFHLAELNSRMRALIRRKKFEGHKSLDFNGLQINLESKEVYAGSERISLSRKEYDLLLYFVTNQNRVLSRETIAEHLWGDSYDQADNHDLIYAHIKNLRRKLTLAGEADHLETVYGLGYRMKTT